MNEYTTVIGVPDVEVPTGVNVPRYKIMTRLHTEKENVFAFHMVINDNDETVEYCVATPEEAAEQAIKLLGRVGYEDLRIVDDKSYYIDLVYGVKATPEENLYKLEILPSDRCVANPNLIENIRENSTVYSIIKFYDRPESFHLIIDDKEYKTGLPKWINYEKISDTEYKMFFSGITRDHVIEIIVDNDIYSL